MPSFEARRIEVYVTNDASGGIVIVGPELLGGPSSTWISGETPTAGGTFMMMATQCWGTQTSAANGFTGGSVQLAGAGNGPVTIQFNNDPASGSTCTVIPNDTVTGTVKQMTDPNAAHSCWDVLLQLVTAAPVE